MTEATRTERNPELRCTSEDIETPKRTHYCRLTKPHTDKHECICHRTWERTAA